MNRISPRLLALLAIFIAAALAQQAVLPLMEGGDEVLHLNYAQYLLSNNRLPERSDVTPGVLQTSGQPPLYYWIGAQVLRLLRVPPSNPATVFDTVMNTRNRWYAPPNQWNPVDNRNVFLHGNTQRFDMPDAENAVRALRLVSLVFGLLAVLGAYGALRELFRSESWVLVGTAIFALTPQMVHMSAIVHNDVGAATFPALILWQSLRLLRKGITLRRLLLLGVLLGMGGLTKISALLVAPAVAAAILLAWRRERGSLIRLIGTGLAAALPFGLLFGSWALWGWLTARDPLGTATHLRPGYFYDPALTLAQVVPLLPELYLGYWGKLGAAIYLHPLTYTLFGALLALAAFGFVVQRPRLSVLARQHTVVLLIAVVVTALGVLYWLQTIQFITGRLLYPAHLVFVAAITAGLMRLPRRLAQTGAIGGLAFVSLILAPLDITIAFQPPPLLTSVPPLQGTPIDYAKTIRLLGTRQDSPILIGSRHEVSLCWQVLQEADRPLAYSIKFIHDGMIVGDRTTIFGLGRFPSDRWQPGDTFCDAVDVPITQPPQSGQVYDVVVVLFDAITEAADIPATALDGAPVPIPFIGQVVNPAGDQRTALNAATTPMNAVVPEFAALEGIAVEGDLAAGQTVSLSLVWQGTGRTNEDWSEFIHLVGADTGIVLSDGKPGEGNYPTWAWSPGEYIVERRQITIPADLRPGTYQIVIGFYRPSSGERVAILEGDQPAANNSARLMTFEVR